MGKLEVETPPVFRLPEWNDLSNAQRRDLVAEAEHLGGAYDCTAMAAVMYAKIRDLVQVEPPPLMMRLHAPAPSHVAAESGAALADFIRDQVCCARPIGGCELNEAEECPAERVRSTIARLEGELAGARFIAALAMGALEQLSGDHEDALAALDLANRQVRLAVEGAQPVWSGEFAGVKAQRDAALEVLKLYASHADAWELVQDADEETGAVSNQWLEPGGWLLKDQGQAADQAIRSLTEGQAEGAK